MAAAARENYYIKNTLICLLKAVEGKVTTVELRNENAVTGRVDDVDGYMNISMSNVCYKSYRGNMTNFDSFFVQGVNVRYVHIPDEIDMRKAMEKYIKLESDAQNKVQKRIRDAAMKKIKKRQEAVLKAEKRQEEKEETVKQSTDKVADQT